MQGTAKWRIEERVSAKSGKPYKVIVVTFQNGYEMTTFLTAEQEWIISNSVKQ